MFCFRPYFLLAVFCLLTAATAQAQDFPPQGFKEMSSEESPQGKFKIVHFKRDPADFSSESQIWLQSLEPEFKTQLLFTHNNRAGWVLSEDEKFIAINHHEGSGTGLLHVFVCGKDGKFRETRKDFSDVVHNLMAARLKLKGRDTAFDHEYCYADAWLRDGYLLAHLRGNFSGKYYLEEWYFIYDAKRDRFLWDLSTVNRGVFQLVEHGKR